MKWKEGVGDEGRWKGKRARGKRKARKERGKEAGGVHDSGAELVYNF